MKQHEQWSEVFWSRTRRVHTGSCFILFIPVELSPVTGPLSVAAGELFSDIHCQNRRTSDAISVNASDTSTIEVIGT